VREDSAALPTVSPLPQPSGSGPQSDSTRPILYYEEVDGEPVLTGLFLDGRRVVMHADNGSVMIPMWSPDGAWAAYGTHDATGAGVLTVVNLRGERRNLLVARDSLPLHPRWSPDGRFIAAILMGTRDLSAEPKTVPLVVIGVVDAAVRSRVAIPASALGKYERVKVRWSPDGRRILVAGEMAVVATIATGSIDIIARQPVTTEWGGAEAVYYFAQSQSGRTLGAFYRRRLADRKPTQVASADQVARLGATESIVPLSRRVVVSPDGKRLALWGRASENSPDIVRLYDMSVDSLIDLEKPAATFPQAGRIMGLQWGPQGRGLAALVSTNEGLEIQYLEAASGQWRKLATVRVGGAADYYGFGILSLSWTQ
jgi:dipeptidyl aminopeptidase/acylaminoacyl peptidase